MKMKILKENYEWKFHNEYKQNFHDNLFQIILPEKLTFNQFQANKLFPLVFS